MKRIIDGVTYNTATSTLLARSDYEVDYNHSERPCQGMLYQTRAGAYFVHQIIDVGWDDETSQIEYRHRFQTLSGTEAQTWIMTGDVEVLHNPFEDPPEAEAEAEAGSTIYVRVPLSLKQRLENEAKQESISGNAWSIRCIETCLATKAVDRGLPVGTTIDATRLRNVMGEVYSSRFADHDEKKIADLREYLDRQLPSNGAGAISAARLRETLVGVIAMTSGW